MEVAGRVAGAGAAQTPLEGIQRIAVGVVGHLHIPARPACPGLLHMSACADEHLGVGGNAEAIVAAGVAAGGGQHHRTAGIHGFHPHTANRRPSDLAVIQPSVGNGHQIEGQATGNAYQRLARGRTLSAGPVDGRQQEIIGGALIQAGHGVRRGHIRHPRDACPREINGPGKGSAGRHQQRPPGLPGGRLGLRGAGPFKAQHPIQGRLRVVQVVTARPADRLPTHRHLAVVRIETQAWRGSNGCLGRGRALAADIGGRNHEVVERAAGQSGHGGRGAGEIPHGGNARRREAGDR